MNRPRSQIPRRLALGALSAILLAAGVWGGRVGWLVISLQGRTARLQQAAADPRQVRLDALAQDVRDARQELIALRSDLGPLLWLGARLGGDAQAAEPLLDAAVETASAGDEALSALASALDDPSSASFSVSAWPRWLDALMAARPELERASVRLDAAEARLASIDGPLSPRVERAAAQMTELVSLARQGVGAGVVAPELLGREGPRTYLVLVQNSDELRPTGGFISNVGRVVISRGVIITQTFEDSYAVDDFTQPYPAPPQPLWDYMGSELWVLRDANWSPDFPTTARDAIQLYQISRPEQIDGVIGINQRVLQVLIESMEPLQVEGRAEPLTAANAERMIREAWNPGPGGASYAWMRNRKQFIGSTARAMMDKMSAGNVRWARLGKGLMDALRQRQLTIYTAGPEATRAALARLNWDGALRRSERGTDFLMIVDANVGFGKVNPLVDESVDYGVTLRPDGTGRAVATVDYRHRGDQPGIVCTPRVHYEDDVTYEKMMHRCYYDYVRLLVPQGSRLETATPRPVPGQYLPSGQPTDGRAQTLPDHVGRSVMAQFFVVEYGGQVQARLEYDLPVVVMTQDGIYRYALVLQKQSGTDALPAKVTLNLPAGARLLSARPGPARQAGESLEFNLTLDIDRQIEVEFALGK